MKENIVLIGAGSAVFMRGLICDMLQRGMEGELALVDTDPGALATAESLARKMFDLKKPRLRLRASTDRRAVLGGASAVICTIGVGGRRAWEQDVFIPRKHGIFQPVGDTTMPGGTSRGLRMIPAMVDIAKDVLDLCPQALFFNYGNPMSVTCRGVHKATGARMIGLCHGVPHVHRYLAAALGVEPARVGFDVAGINHLAWFTAVRVDGRDAMPRLRELARARGSDTDPASDPFSWRLLLAFGAFPAVLDRHVVEFFPQFFRDGSYHGRKLGVDAFSFEQTIADGDRVFAEMKAVASADAPLPADYLAGMEGEHEQVVDIIASIRKDDGRLFPANLPNTGQVPDLPAGAVLETMAVATAGGLKPVAHGPLGPALAGTLSARLLWAETTVDAALEGSRDKFVQALVLDGACLSIEAAHRLADELLAAQAAYLPRFHAKKS